MPVFTSVSDNIIVGADFINNIMPQLNGEFVKVYLYARLLCEQGASAEYSGIADKLGLLESDVVRAFSALESVGVLKITDNYVSFCSAPAEASVQISPVDTSSDTEEPVSVPPMREYSPTDMSGAASADASLADMFQLAQEVLGKPLNPSDTNTLYWLYDSLGYSPEVILMLLEYCVSIEKRSMAYIEKVAVAWHERGVKTIEDVERVITEEQSRSDIKKSLRQLFGIRDRSLTKIEENFIDEWSGTLGMSEEMIALAYEYSIIQINKLSFPYMDKIIKRWNADGITTVEQAEADNERFRERNLKDSGSGNHSGYNYDDLEKRAWNNID